MRIRKRIILGSVLFLVLLFLIGAAGVWIYKDSPRRFAQTAIAEKLGASVRLGALEIQSPRRFILRNLSLHKIPTQPRIESIHIGILTVSASLRELSAGRFEALIVEGAEAVLIHPGDVDPPDTGPLEASIGTLELSDCRVVIKGGGETLRLDLEGTLKNMGSGSAALSGMSAQGSGGTVHVLSDRVTLAPLACFSFGEEVFRILEEQLRLDFRQPLSNLNATLDVDDGGRVLELHAEIDDLLVIGVQGPDASGLPCPVVDLRLSTADDPDRRLEGRFIIPETASAEFSLSTVHGAAGLLLERGNFESTDPSSVLPLLRFLPGTVDMDGEIRLEVTSDSSDSLIYTLDATAERFTLKDEEDRVTLEDAHLEVTGTTPRQCAAEQGSLTLILHTEAVSGSVGGMTIPRSLSPLILTASGDHDGQGPVRFEGNGTVSTAAAGQVALEGETLFTGPETAGSLRWDWHGVDANFLNSIFASTGVSRNRIRFLSGRFSARGSLEGPFENPEITGRFVAEDAGIETLLDEPGETLLLAGCTVDTRATLSPGGRLGIGDLTGSGELLYESLPAMPFNIEGDGAWNRISGEGHVSRFKVEIPDMTLLDAEAERSRLPSGGHRFYLEASLQETDMTAVRRFLEPLSGELVPDYDLQAMLAGRLSLDMGEDGVWSAAGTAETSDTQLSSADGARVLQGLDGEWQFEAGGGVPGRPWQLDGTAELEGFVLLWGRVFADYEALRPRHRFSIEYGPSPTGDAAGSRWFAGGVLHLADGAEARHTMNWTRGEPLGYTVHLAVANLERFFHEQVRPQLADSFEVLDRLKVRGSLSATARGELSDDNRTIGGRIALNGIDVVERGGGMAVRGLELDLPLDLRWSNEHGSPPAEVSSHSTGVESKKGRLSFDTLSFEELTIAATETDLTVRADSVGLRTGLHIPLLGGTLSLNALELHDLFQNGRRLESDILVQGIRLDRLSDAFGWPPLDGVLDGRFPKVRLSTSRLVVDGGGEVALFGGRVSLSDISGEDVLSRFPQLTFSADFEDIDLRQVTRKFDFGEMSGIARGTIRNCELFDGVPVRFQAELETVERRGVPQTIDVKAINNVAILGTGSGLGLFDRGIHKFTERYKYDKFGVEMSLDRDVFLLRGTEARGDRELFLKGRLPLRLDVVNAQPGKTVSFRAMLERMKSMDFSAASIDR